MDATREQFDSAHEIELGVKNLKLLKITDPEELRILVEQLNKRLLPVYVRLRAMGYIDADFNK